MFEEEEEMYSISPAGIERIWSWARLQAQVCEMEHPDGECDDENHIVAFLLVFVLPEVPT